MDSIINAIYLQLINIYNCLKSYKYTLNFILKYSISELLQLLAIIIIPLLIFTLLKYITNNWKDSVIMPSQQYFIYGIGTIFLLVILSFYISMPIHIIIAAIIPSISYILYCIYLPKHNMLCHCIYYIYILFVLLLKLNYIPIYYLITIASIAFHYYTHVSISTPWYVYIYKAILIIISYHIMKHIAPNPVMLIGLIVVHASLYTLCKYIMQIGRWLQNETTINHIFGFILYIISAINVIYYTPINNFTLQIVLLLLGLNYMYRPSNTSTINVDTTHITPFNSLVLMFGIGICTYLGIISGYSIIVLFVITLIGCIYNFYIWWNKLSFNIFLKISILLLCCINVIYRFMTLDPNISLIGCISLICINITSMIFNHYIKNNNISNIIILNILYNTFAVIATTNTKVLSIYVTVIFIICMYNQSKQYILETIKCGIYNQIITSGLIFILLQSAQYIYVFGYLLTLICMFTHTFNSIEIICLIQTIMSLFKIYNKNAILFNNMHYNVSSRLWIVNYTDTIHTVLRIIYISALRNKQYWIHVIYNKYIKYMCILCMIFSAILYIFNIHLNIYILIPITYMSIYSVLYLFKYTIYYIRNNLLYRLVWAFAFLVFEISLPMEFIILLPILITIYHSITD